MAGRFYVYTYVDPETALPFYVGKGQGHRARKHFHQTHSRPLAGKLARMRSAGVEPRIDLEYFEDEGDAYRREAELITLFGRRADGGFLFNVLPAGERTTGFKGQHHTDEAKARISAKLKGRKLRPEHAAAIGAAKKGIAFCVGEARNRANATKRTPEYRQYLSERAKKTVSPEQLAAMTESARRATLGKKQSPEHVAKKLAAFRATIEKRNAKPSNA